MSKQVWKVVDINGKTGKPIVNKNYIPAKDRPKWCKKTNKELIPKFRCLCDDIDGSRCPFYAFTEADREEYIALEKAMDKINKKREKDLK